MFGRLFPRAGPWIGEEPIETHLEVDANFMK